MKRIIIVFAFLAFATTSINAQELYLKTPDPPIEELSLPDRITSVPRLAGLPNKTRIEVSLSPNTLITNDPDIHDRFRLHLRGVGTVFTATVERDVVVNNFVVIIRGAKAYGHITESYYSMYKKSRLNLELTGVTLYDGSILPIKTRLDNNLENNSQPGAEHVIGQAVQKGAALGAVFSLLSSSEALNTMRAIGLILGGSVGTLDGLSDRKYYRAKPVYIFDGRKLWFKIRK